MALVAERPGTIPVLFLVVGGRGGGGAELALYDITRAGP